MPSENKIILAAANPKIESYDREDLEGIATKLIKFCYDTFGQGANETKDHLDSFVMVLKANELLTIEEINIAAMNGVMNAVESKTNYVSASHLSFWINEYKNKTRPAAHGKKARFDQDHPTIVPIVLDFATERQKGIDIFERHAAALLDRQPFCFFSGFDILFTEARYYMADYLFNEFECYKNQSMYAKIDSLLQPLKEQNIDKYKVQAQTLSYIYLLYLRVQMRFDLQAWRNIINTNSSNGVAVTNKEIIKMIEAQIQTENTINLNQ